MRGGVCRERIDEGVAAVGLRMREEVVQEKDGDSEG